MGNGSMETKTENKFNWREVLPPAISVFIGFILGVVVLLIVAVFAVELKLSATILGDLFVPMSPIDVDQVNLGSDFLWANFTLEDGLSGSFISFKPLNGTGLASNKVIMELQGPVGVSTKRWDSTNADEIYNITDPPAGGYELWGKAKGVGNVFEWLQIECNFCIIHQGAQNITVNNTGG